MSNFATLWSVACQASLSMGFSRQEYWNGLPWPPPGDLSDPGIKHVSLMSPHWQMGSVPPVPPGKPLKIGMGKILRAMEEKNLCMAAYSIGYI